MKIDVVSDVACPWCAVGLNALEIALDRSGLRGQVELHFQPFELNPTMPAEGADAAAYLMKKYGMGPAQLAQSRQTLRERGAAVGFAFGERPWVWNTFDAHRLLCWAEGEGRQRELKHALLTAYHGRAENVSDAGVLARIAGEAGLDADRAKQILAGDEFAAEVREREAHWQGLGISAVPSVVIDDRHLIQGGQPPEVFEQALRQLAGAAGAQVVS